MCRQARLRRSPRPLPTNAREPVPRRPEAAPRAARQGHHRLRPRSPGPFQRPGRHRLHRRPDLDSQPAALLHAAPGPGQRSPAAGRAPSSDRVHPGADHDARLRPEHRLAHLQHTASWYPSSATLSPRQLPSGTQSSACSRARRPGRSSGLLGLRSSSSGCRSTPSPPPAARMPPTSRYSTCRTSPGPCTPCWPPSRSQP